MAWLWSDDLARLLMERDGVSRDRLVDWLSGPTAHRSDLDALEFARFLLGETPHQAATGTTTSAA